MATHRSHLLTSLSLSYLLKIDYLNIFLIFFFTNFPDYLDNFFSKKIYIKGKIIKHSRGFFHDLSIWLFLFFLLYLIQPNGIDVYKNLNFKLYMIPLAAIFHLFLDFFTPYGIFFFKKRIRFVLFSTWSIKENLFVFIFCIICLLIRYYID